MAGWLAVLSVLVHAAVVVRHHARMFGAGLEHALLTGSAARSAPELVTHEPQNGRADDTGTRR
ncbi:MAG: hypothetical protein V9E89_19135 [Ilumatobacteraceae bacterium]